MDNLDIYEIDLNIDDPNNPKWTIKPFQRYLSIASISRNGGLKISFGKMPFYVNKDKFDTHAVFAVGEVYLSVFSKGFSYNEATLQYCYLQLRIERNGRTIEKTKSMIDTQNHLLSTIGLQNKVFESIMPPPF
jgi:hypothetical protein